MAFCLTDWSNGSLRSSRVVGLLKKKSRSASSSSLVRCMVRLFILVWKSFWKSGASLAVKGAKAGVLKVGGKTGDCLLEAAPCEAEVAAVFDS